MSLRQQPIAIAFREGIDTKTSSKNSVPGRLMGLENGVFTKVGEIRKRNGYTAISRLIENGDALTSADALATYRDELLAFSGGRVLSYADAIERWIDRGAAVSAVPTETSVVRNSYAQFAPDLARGADMTCVAWEDTRGGVRYSLLDDTTGTAYVSDAAVSTSSGGARPRVVYFGGAFYIFYGVGTNIFYRKVDATAPTVLETEQNPISTLTVAQVWDVRVSGARIIVAWYDSTLATVAVNWFNASMALDATTRSVTGDTCVAIWTDSVENVWIASTTATTQYLSVWDGSWTALATNVTIGSETNINRIAGVSYGANLSRIVTEKTGDILYATTVHETGTILSANAVLVRSLTMTGRGFEHGGRPYFPAMYDATLQATLFVVDGITGDVIAKASAGTAGIDRARYTVSDVTEHSAGVFTFSATVKSALVATSGGVYTLSGVQTVKVDFTSAPRFRSCELGHNLIVAGAVVGAYDGATYCEQGFHVYPEGTTAAVGVGGGGLTNGEVYRWKVTYEWTDTHGNVHRSAPGAVTISAAESYTSAAGNETVTLTVPTLRITGKSLVRIVVYRTEGNGPVYYRLGSMSSPTLNDKTADSVTFVDTYADTAITGNEILYTDGAAGSELPNIALGGASLAVSHRGRVFAKTAPQRVAFSKQVEDGRPVEFSDELYLSPDARGGVVTALASMDDKLVIFKERAIFAVNGEGPDFTGAGTYPEPTLVTSDVGCSDARSVVLTNAGLMFKSAKGIYLLDRSLQVTYIGAPVEDYNGLTLTSAQVVPNCNQVRWTSSGSVTIDDEPRTGMGLVYDYVFNQWSTFTNHDAADATVWRGVYAMIKSDGKTYTESSTSFADDGAWVRLRLTTSWLTFAGVQGFQRIYRVMVLGDYKSTHSLRIRLGYNYELAWPYDQTIDAESVVGAGTWGSDATWGSGGLWGGAAPVEWFCARPEKQKCSAIRVCIEDSQESSAGEGFAISNLLLLVGVKRGPFKFTAERHT